MKRTLLAALCSITLGGGAVYADNFEKVEVKPFGEIIRIPEDLTSDGKSAICFAYTDKVYNNEYSSAYIQLYDKALNPTKTLEWKCKQYEYNLYKKTASCEITNRRILRNGGDPYTLSYNDTLLNSMEEFKGYIREKIASADVSDNAFFTDNNGNWSCSYRIRQASSYDLNGMEVKDGEIAISEDYYYYDKSDNKLHKTDHIVATTIDEQALTWEIDETQTQTHSIPNLFLQGTYIDFDKDKSSDICCISQSLINNEDKYMFFITEPNSISHLDYYTVQECSFPQERFNVSLMLTKGEYDNYYSYAHADLIASNEDGEELFRIKNTYISGDSFSIGSGTPYTLFRSDGKLYLQCEEYSLKYNEENKRYYTYTENVIYLIKSQNGTGVTEVSRTKPMKIEKTFNTAGMPVSKDSHGIIIADNGMKYINK